MAFEFKLPDIGEGVVEGELVRWMVEEGQPVEEDTPLFEVLTDKVSAVIPSPRKGVVARRHFKEGDMVPVGAVVLTIEEAAGAQAIAEAAPPPTVQATAESVEAEVAAREPDAQPARAAPVQRPPLQSRPQARVPAQKTAAAAPDAAEPDAAAPERVRAAPATRKLARELGIDLTQVEGSGDNGRVTREDVEAAARAAQVPAPQPAAQPAARTAQPAPRPTEPAAARAAVQPTPIEPGADEDRIAIRGLRRKIHQKMRESKDHAAHFTYVEEVDFTEIVAMRNQLAARDVDATFLPFVMKALVLALKRPDFKYLNASVDEAANEIVVKYRYNIGIAAATEPGLVVAVVRDVDRKNLRELADEVRRIGEGARTGKLELDQMSGSTFTITSLGKIGGMFATPIINYPEVAILGLHKVEKRPVVVGDQIVIRERMYMSCSFDHRIIDGHVGAAFVQAIKEYLEHPALLLADLV